MNFKKQAIAVGIAAATGLVAAGANAAAITSITIEDVGSTIGGANGGGVGTYSSTLDGNVGGFRFAPINPTSYLGVTGFTGDNGNDMKWDGTAQANYSASTTTAFTTGFTFAGSPFEPDLFGGGAVGDITGGVMTVSNLDFGGYYTGASFQFNMPPDAGTLAVNWVVAVGGGDYKVSFQWQHYITPTDDPSYTYAGLTARWILEGTAHTATSQVPVPAAAYLFGSGLVGLAGVARRRRKRAE